MQDGGADMADDRVVSGGKNGGKEGAPGRQTWQADRVDASVDPV
jgi:hypothetical protein